MPRLRIALAQVDPTVGDLAGNAALVRGWTRKAADSGAHLVAFPEMMLTGYPVEDLVFRESFVAASQAALATLAPTWPTTAWATSPVVVGYLDADGPAAAAAPATAPAAAPATRSPCCTSGAVVATLLQAPPAQLRRLRRGPLLRARRHAQRDPATAGVDIALTICEDLWQAGGPFAVAARGPGRPGRQHQRLAVRAEQGRRPAAAGGPAGGRGRRAPSPTSTWSAGRTSWSSTATRWWSPPDGTLLARAPQFAEELLVVDLDLPAATADAGRRRPPGARCG